MLCCGYVWLILLDLSTEAMVTTVTTMATTAATATRIMAATDMEASPVCFYECFFKGAPKLLMFGVSVFGA